MPQGVKGSGKARVPKPRAATPAQDDLDAVDARVPTCARDGAALQANGECASCKTRAIRFKELHALEVAARQCGICHAPTPARAYRGERVCKLCRKLLARERALKPSAKKGS